jgi:mannose-6-phosphate isomerase-like protein (cupin superfamily)
MQMNGVSDFEKTSFTLSDLQATNDNVFSTQSMLNEVSLKHLVTGKMTGNKISCHLLKIKPFCTYDTHVHENNLEIHYVISGDGTCQIADETVSYVVGSVGTIPSNISHKIMAGKNGICILSKYVPALI